MAKIIIVDDDPAMVAVLSEVLREHRHEVIPASSPERAMQLTRDESPIWCWRTLRCQKASRWG